MSKKEKQGQGSKPAKKPKHKIVIGIDQSYADSGIGVALDNKLMGVSGCRPPSTYSNTMRRELLANKLTKVFSMMDRKMYELDNCELMCIIERIRLQSAKPGEQHFLNLNYIKGIGALNAVIVDTASRYNIPVYSADTRSWKAQVVGTSSPLENEYGFAPEKWPTIQWCIKQGYEDYIIDYDISPRKQKCVIEREEGGAMSRFTYNDNKADAIGITMYGFNPNRKLEEEH